jgi:hypothetical protein
MRVLNERYDSHSFETKRGLEKKINMLRPRGAKTLLFYFPSFFLFGRIPDKPVESASRVEIEDSTGNNKSKVSCCGKLKKLGSQST